MPPRRRGTCFERYDRKIEDTFAVQDEVARTIVAVLAVHVNRAQTERALAKPPAVWLAYDHYLRAAHTFAVFHSSFNKENLLQVRRSLEQTLAIDPNYARAHAILSRSSIQWAIQTLEAHMRLDPFYLQHFPSLLGFAYYPLGRHVDALPH